MYIHKHFFICSIHISLYPSARYFARIVYYKHPSGYREMLCIWSRLRLDQITFHCIPQGCFNINSIPLTDNSYFLYKIFFCHLHIFTTFRKTFYHEIKYNTYIYYSIRYYVISRFLIWEQLLLQLMNVSIN